jgi:hypothetical protein
LDLILDVYIILSSIVDGGWLEVVNYSKLD